MSVFWVHTQWGQNATLTEKILQSDKNLSKHPKKNTSVHIRWGREMEIYGFTAFGGSSVGPRCILQRVCVCASTASQYPFL